MSDMAVNWLVLGVMAVAAFGSLFCAASYHYQVTGNLRETLAIAGTIIAGAALVGVLVVASMVLV